jgi:hypothetical protein
MENNIQNRMETHIKKRGPGRPSKAEVEQRPPPEPAIYVSETVITEVVKLCCPRCHGTRVSRLAGAMNKALAKRGAYYDCNDCRRPFILFADGKTQTY